MKIIIGSAMVETYDVIMACPILIEMRGNRVDLQCVQINMRNGKRFNIRVPTAEYARKAVTRIMEVGS